MITYSTNWMGPISTKWYEDRDIPFEIRETSGKILPKKEYKHFLENYSCGRIDIRGLDEEENYGGWGEYSVAPMRTEDWNAFSDWLEDLTTDTLLLYNDLIEQFEQHYDKKIRWQNECISIR